MCPNSLTRSERLDARRKLDVLRERILRSVSGAGIASDQDYRVADLAIDFCEDVPPLGTEDIDAIVSLARDAGATARVSSIHVNIWYGEFDKLQMTRIMCAELFEEVLGDNLEDYIYVGDSPNDSPMFAYFPLSVGVANVTESVERLSAAPKFITREARGAGFCEVADRILNAR